MSVRGARSPRANVDTRIFILVSGLSSPRWASGLCGYCPRPNPWISTEDSMGKRGKLDFCSPEPSLVTTISSRPIAIREDGSLTNKTELKLPFFPPPSRKPNRKQIEAESGPRPQPIIHLRNLLADRPVNIKKGKRRLAAADINSLHHSLVEPSHPSSSRLRRQNGPLWLQLSRPADDHGDQRRRHRRPRPPSSRPRPRLRQSLQCPSLCSRFVRVLSQDSFCYVRVDRYCGFRFWVAHDHWPVHGPVNDDRVTLISQLISEFWSPYLIDNTEYWGWNSVWLLSFQCSTVDMMCT